MKLYNLYLFEQSKFHMWQSKPIYYYGTNQEFKPGDTVQENDKIYFAKNKSMIRQNNIYIIKPVGKIQSLNTKHGIIYCADKIIIIEKI